MATIWRKEAGEVKVKKEERSVLIAKFSAFRTDQLKDPNGTQIQLHLQRIGHRDWQWIFHGIRHVLQHLCQHPPVDPDDRPRRICGMARHNKGLDVRRQGNMIVDGGQDIRWKWGGVVCYLHSNLPCISQCVTVFVSVLGREFFCISSQYTVPSWVTLQSSMLLNLFSSPVQSASW